MPLGNGRLRLLEVKATRTPKPAMAANLLRLSKNIKSSTTQLALVCWPQKTHKNAVNTLCPGVKLMGVEEF